MGKLTFSSIRDIRVIRGSILPLVALACFFSFSSICRAGASPASVLGSATGAVALQGVEEPIQLCANFPNPWNDLDEISLPSDDEAVIPSRDDQETPHFTTTTLDSVALHQPGFVPAFLFPTYFSQSLREQIRERAPPVLA